VVLALSPCVPLPQRGRGNFIKKRGFAPLKLLFSVSRQSRRVLNDANVFSVFLSPVFKYTK
jgi:hypothetical protein